MEKVKGFGILCVCLLLGVATRPLVPLPIPETIYGMAYLLIALLTHIVHLSQVEAVAQLLLENLTFFFLAITVGVVDQLNVLRNNLLPMAILCVLSAFLTLGVTAKSVEWAQKHLTKHS